MKFNLNLIAQITNGTAIGNNITIEGFSFNSKDILSNYMFIALETGNNNGHIYLQNAKNNGANSYLISSNYFNKHKKIILSLKNVVVVNNTYNAMLCLAKYNISKYNIPLIAITGSFGKTSLKEMLNVSLKDYNIFKTSGNFNNHIGVPFCLLSLNNNYKYAVVEMGMSAFGEIDFLSNLAKPNTTIITAIGNSHFQNFNSRKDIAKAKAEIFNGMPPKGNVILNYDDDFFDFLKNDAINKNQNVISVSINNINANCFVIFSNFYFNSWQDYGFTIQANIFGNIINYSLPTIYKHNVLLSIFVLATCYTYNINLTTVAKNLLLFKTTTGRGEIIFLNNNNLLIDDSYNASSYSIKAGLKGINLILNKSKVLVLGEMLELGAISQQEHESLENDILQTKPNLVILVGTQMQFLYNKINNKVNCIYFSNVNNNITEIMHLINIHNAQNTIFFIKGSFGSKVLEISNKIRQHND